MHPPPDVEGALDILTHPLFLALWAISALLSLAVLAWDLHRNNAHLAPLMKWVWAFTVAYSGGLGLAGYFYAGRKEISSDTIWRRGFRSVAHCYSGCGVGEITGVIIAAGIFSLSGMAVASLTFALAYVAGFAMTMGPLIQEGTSLADAFRDALFSETPSITVMEAVAIGVDLGIGGRSGIGDVLFWSALVVSLSLGLCAAYPVNVLLIRFGIKEGMMDPRASA